VHRRTVSAHASRGTPCQMCGQLIPQGNVTCPQCHS
jgi:RNA polymerase subunit RPABC4/transcription elongation factor Spt4